MCMGSLWVHWQFEPFLKGLCRSAPPFIPFLSFGGGQGWQFALTICPSSSFLCASHVSGRPRNLVQWLSPVILRVLHSVVLKSLIQEGKAIALSFMVLLTILHSKWLCGKKLQQGWAFLAWLPGRWQGGHLHAPNFKICQIHSITIHLNLLLWKLR